MFDSKREFYNLCEQLSELQKFKKVDDYQYTSIFKTGDFDELYDYNTGLLFISIYLERSELFKGVISISTADNKIWQAWGTMDNPITPELAREIIAIFDEFNGGLPTAKELNKQLTKIGLYGMSTG